MAAIALKLQNFRAKPREFQPQNCAISAPNVRAMRKEDAQSQCACLARRGTHACIFCEDSAGSGRVSRAKIAPNFFEIFAIFTENRKFSPPIEVQKAAQSSGKAALPAKRAAIDHPHYFDATCVRRWPQSR